MNLSDFMKNKIHENASRPSKFVTQHGKLTREQVFPSTPSVSKIGGRLPLTPNEENPNLPSDATVQDSSIQNIENNTSYPDTRGKEDVSDENIYVNIQVYNPIDNPDEFGIVASSNITQSSALLANPSDYRICCLRFSIPANLPLFIYPDDVIAEDLYQIEIIDTDNGIYSIQSLIYQDWAPGLNTYNRGIYYYEHMIEFINTAIKQAYIDCATNPSFPILPANCVQLIYEPQTQLFYFEVPSDYQLYFSGRIQIRLSLSLYINFFPSFAAKIIIDPVDLPARIVFTPNRSSLLGTIFKQYNETPCISSWNAVSKLLILSNTIPINNEVISSSNQKTQSVLLDFLTPSGVSSTEPFQFNATLHRWYDFNSTQPLSQLQISVQVVFKDGSIFDLYIQRGEYLSFKFLIRSKTSQLTN